MRIKRILKRIFVIALFLLIICVLFTVITNITILFKTHKYIYSEPDITGQESFVAVCYDEEGNEVPYFDCIIVPGCGVYPDGEPTPLLSDRLDIAISLYNKGVAPKILMSGDHGEDSYNEVAAMRQYALDRGIPSEDIFMDHAGFSTYETMARASQVFGVTKAIIVTQEYHLPRSIYNAQNQGIEAYGVIATGHIFKSQAYYSFREYFARTKDFVFGIIRPAPTYLGDDINIHGSGEVTID